MEKDCGARIRQRRLELKMTQKELASVCGLSQAAISHFESSNRSRKPTFSSLVKLSDGLRCTVDYILGKSKSDIAELLADPRMLEMLEGIQHFSEERKAVLVKMYEYFKEREDLRLAGSEGIRPNETTPVSDRGVV